MKIEISLNDDEFEKAMRIFEQLGLKKRVTDKASVGDKLGLVLKGPDGEVKQMEEGKS